MVGEQVAICGVVIVTEKGLPPSVPALGDMMRNVGDHDTSEAGHPPMLSAWVVEVN